MLRRIFTFLTLIASLAMTADDSVIVEHIMSVNDNTIIQPAELYRRLLPAATSELPTEQPVTALTPGAAAGFRVQVFSDNNARTAKNEARTKSHIISARFPQYATYVRYTSPYWRLKVGDFRTKQAAEEAAEELRKAFPAFSKEIRVVRDRITISE